MTTLYGLNTCDTCKKARKWLDGAGIAYTFVDYRTPSPSAQTLSEWARQRGAFEALINKSSSTWRQLPAPRRAPADDAQCSALLREYPALIRRPLLVMDDGSVHQGFSQAGFSALFGVGT